MEVQTLTPDQMLDGARDRIFKIAEWHLKRYPRLTLTVGKKYKFKFDSKATYTYKGQFTRPYYPDGYAHIFQRESDEALMYATKYSESPEEILCNIHSTAMVV